MSKKHFIILVLVSFLGGILGGVLSNQYFFVSAYAKNKNVPAVIEAKEFRVINDDGKTYMTFNNSGLTIKEVDKENVYSLTLNYFGLHTELNMPKSWKQKKVVTNISPWGFAYREYSGSEIEKQSKNPLLDLFDIRNNIKIGASDNSNLGGAIELYDNNYKQRLVIGGIDLWQPKTDSKLLRPPSSIVMFNDTGNVIWQAP